MGIEKRLEAASTFTGYPEDGPNLQPLARDALSAIWTLKGKFTAVETELAQARRQRDDAIRRAERAEAEVDRITDENEDLRQVPWPKWATECLRIVREHSGYDGYDDGTEGVDLPQELEETLVEYDAQANRARAKTAAAENQVVDLSRRLDKARAVYVTARTLWEAVSLVQPGGGMASHETVYRARRALGDAPKACTVWDEATGAPDLSPKPQFIDTSAQDVDGGDGWAGTQADEIRRLQALCRDYETILADKWRNAREIDVALHGEDGAAKQSSLCDLVDAARAMRDRAEMAETALAKARAMLRRFQWAGTTELSDGGDEACCPCCEWPERQGQHAPGCDLAAEIGAVVVSHETPIGERQADDGMGGGHGG